MSTTELLWLEDKLGFERIDESRISNIFYFTLIWSIFEKELCENYADIRKHPKDIANRISASIQAERINSVFEYFIGRYCNGSETNELFDAFSFNRSNEKKDIVKATLLNEHALLTEKIETLLYIAFRLRNNLYHGMKEVNDLSGQNENFKQINKLLMHVIELQLRF